MSNNWMIYGAYGYTGRLVSELAVEMGHEPVLAGRSEEKLNPLASELDLDSVVVSLDDEDRLRNAVEEVSLVYHAAGPFVKTAEPMMEACIQGGTHYLDVTGELPVFQECFARDERAEEAGICLISGMGFDVVPTDCMAAYVASRVANPDHLELGLDAELNPSSGTAKTVLEMLPSNSFNRTDGELVEESFGDRTREVDFPGGKKSVVSAPLGDLETAWQATGIPNITTYVAMPPTMIPVAKYGAPIMRGLLSVRPIRGLAQWIIEKLVDGPDEEFRQGANSYVWARATNEAGEYKEAWLRTIETYQFTAEAAVKGAVGVIDEDPSGAHTPATALGEDFVLEISNTKRADSTSELE